MCVCIPSPSPSPSDQPGPVRDLKVTVRGDSISISWTAADDNGIDITEYLIRFLLRGQMVYNISSVTTSQEVSRSDIEKVTQDRSMEYSVSVAARNGLGKGEAAVQNFTLPAGECK